MSGNLTQMIEDLLADPTNPEVVRSLCDPDITYVSLNFDNPDLKRIMPWTGTAHGPQAVIDTYSQVGRYWKNRGLSITDRLESGESAAVFGSFTYESHTQHRTVTSPFCILIRVQRGKIVYMQFMEDTFGTAFTFKEGGTWKVRSDPAGRGIEV